ncbi:hypothetical protein [Streptomyces antibioticus]
MRRPSRTACALGLEFRQRLVLLRLGQDAADDAAAQADRLQQGAGRR